MRRPMVVLVAATAATLCAGALVVGWLFGWGNRSLDAETAHIAAAQDVKVGVPTIVSPEQLKELAGVRYPLYWAGDRPGTQLELTVTARNGVFVRYLPASVSAGAPGKYLTIATYESIDGYDALRGASKRGADVGMAKSGAVIAVFKSRPLSTYFSFPSASFQVEVYSPRPGESERLTDDGDVQLLGTTS